LRAAGESLGNYRLDGCTLYVTLEPCPMCLAAISHARVARVVYAAPDPRAGACGGAMDLNRASWHHFSPIIDTGPCEVEAAALLLRFFQHRR
jgi:tRNA(adenine34) deaminase